MLRKRIFKILSVLVAVIIAFSCFCISASAETYGTYYYSIPEFFELEHVSLARANADGNSFDDTGWDVVTLDENGTTINWNALRISVAGDVTYGKGNIWRIDCTLKVLPSVVQKGFSEGSFFITVNQTNYSRYELYDTREWLPERQLLKIDTKENYYGGLEWRSTQKFIAHIPKEVEPDIFERIKVVFYVVNKKTISSGEFLDFTFSDLKLDMYNENDELAYKIVQNQNENTDKIMQNQNENADKIIQNQEQNQEEIKNGWQQENQIDSSTTDDYAAKDKELQDATEQGRSEAVSVFNSFGSLFQSDGHLYKGLLSVSAMFTEFMKIDWLSSLLNFSLAIGIFAFVIGTGSEIFKSSHERYKDDKISKIDSYDERWLM